MKAICNRRVPRTTIMGRRSSSLGERGSVTIYFIAITAAIVLLTGLLIDFARVAAFRQQAELSVKSGVRSTLSSFDPNIYDRYGLFIRGGESAPLLFRETLEGNSASLDGDAFSFLDIQWAEADVLESRPLANHEIFRRQILEEMKYKAPIDLSIELVGRFKGLSGAMKEATATVDVLEKMRKAYDRREAALDKVLANQRTPGEQIHQLLRDRVPYPPLLLTGSNTAGEVRNIVDAALQYEDYVRKRQEDEARIILNQQQAEAWARASSGNPGGPIGIYIPILPIHTAVIAKYESGMRSLAASLSQASTKARLESEDAREKALAALQAAKAANDEMIAIVREAKSTPSSVTAEGTTGTTDQSVDAENIQSLQELRQTAEKLVLAAPFFDEYEAEIRLQHSRGIGLAEEAASFSTIASAAPGSTGNGPSLRAGAERLQQAYVNVIEAYGSEGSVLSQREAKLQAHRSHDRERKEQEQEAKRVWSGVTDFLGTLTGVSGSAEEKQQFEQVSGLYRDNKEWNQLEGEQARKGHNNDPFEGRDEAMSDSNGIMVGLESALLSSRDQLYFSEYAIARLSHYDPSLVSEMLHGGEAPLSIDQQETEYILYGLNNPSANIAAAYGEVFAFRLAVRTMEGLVECRAMGHPLLVLAAALVYGIVKALADLTLLVEKGSVQLSKYIKVDTTYTDYLRLFLLLHGGSATHVARTIAVMEHASGLSFRGAYTYASAEGTASVKLWFFPGLLKVLGRYGNLGGSVKGNRYEATYTADSSYQ
jgi:hypothetical protein